MNHQYIIDHDVVGHYRRGVLAAAEVEAFEAHLIECPECRALLEADSKLERGLRAVATSMVAEPRTQTGALDRTRYVAMAAAIGVLAVAGVLQWRATHTSVPQAGLPTFHFSIMRGTDRGATEIRLPAGVEWYLVEIETPVTVGCCHVIIERDGGEVVWKDDVPAADGDGVVRVLLGHEFLRDGRYRIALTSSATGSTRIVEHDFELQSGT